MLFSVAFNLAILSWDSVSTVTTLPSSELKSPWLAAPIYSGVTLCGLFKSAICEDNASLSKRYSTICSSIDFLKALSSLTRKAASFVSYSWSKVVMLVLAWTSVLKAFVILLVAAVSLPSTATYAVAISFPIILY
jgi:hypothetical protein